MPPFGAVAHEDEEGVRPDNEQGGQADPPSDGHRRRDSEAFIAVITARSTVCAVTATGVRSASVRAATSPAQPRPAAERSFALLSLHFAANSAGVRAAA
jgi:hypothetical protein